MSGLQLTVQLARGSRLLNASIELIPARIRGVMVKFCEVFSVRKYMSTWWFITHFRFGVGWISGFNWRWSPFLLRRVRQYRIWTSLRELSWDFTMHPPKRMSRSPIENPLPTWRKSLDDYRHTRSQVSVSWSILIMKHYKRHASVIFFTPPTIQAGDERYSRKPQRNFHVLQGLHQENADSFK